MTVTFAVRVEITGTADSAPLIVNRACVHPVDGGLANCEWSNETWNFTYVWPMKIHLLHFADLHIGIENYGRLDPATGVNRRVLDFLRRPSPTYQRAFAPRVKRLADAVVLLVGNHDLPTMVRPATAPGMGRR
nr:hypothetical protein [Anaerolineae bacterium]